MAAAALVGGVAALVEGGEERLPDEAMPLGVAADRHVDPTVPGAVGVDRDELPVLVAGPAQLLRGAAHVQHGKEGLQPRDRHLSHGDVDPPALAGLPALRESDHHLGVGLVTGSQVDDRRAALHRWPVWVPGEIHVSTEGLEHRVVTRYVRIVRTQGRDRAPDQLRTHFAERLVVDPQCAVADRQGVRTEDVYR